METKLIVAIALGVRQIVAEMGSILDRLARRLEDAHILPNHL